MKQMIVIMIFLFSAGAVASPNKCIAYLPSECLEVLDSRVFSSQYEFTDVMGRGRQRIQVDVKCKIDAPLPAEGSGEVLLQYKNYHFIKDMSDRFDFIEVNFQKNTSVFDNRIVCDK